MTKKRSLVFLGTVVGCFAAVAAGLYSDLFRHRLPQRATTVVHSMVISFPACIGGCGPTQATTLP
jgi:ABC-type dipeptide/oligopeptide/nickel transport system permease component